LKKTGKPIVLVLFAGKAYGYEFGWRRKDLNGTNLVTRVYFGKPIEKKDKS
jgi:hypothetical protein